VAGRKTSGKPSHSLGRTLKGILFGAEHNQPTWSKVKKEVLGPKEVASIRLKPDGNITARGAVRTPDGWKRDKGNRTRTYRPGQTTKPRAQKRSAERAKDRDRRQGRQQAPRNPDANPNLRRKHKQGPGGQMRGSVQGGLPFPTVPQAAGLDGLRCEWCRGTNVRPLFNGTGRLKKVIGVAPCDHTWAVPEHGPAQKPPAAGSRFLCGQCKNAGRVTISIVSADGVRVSGETSCPTCRGWILHW